MKTAARWLCLAVTYMTAFTVLAAVTGPWAWTLMTVVTLAGMIVLVLWLRQPANVRGSRER